MNNFAHFVFVESLRDACRVADVCFNEHQALVAQQIVEIREIPGVRELIERDKFHVIAARKQHADKVRTDESRSASNQNASHEPCYAFAMISMLFPNGSRNWKRS